MEEIKKIIKNIFKAMGIEALELSVKIDNSIKGKEITNISAEIDERDAKAFIGDNSEGLSALQHILRLIIFKKGPMQSFLALDINNYKEGRKNELIELAVETAKKVRRTKKAVILNPMPAYERRIIHLYLAEQPDIITESIGEEPERKIIVRLYP